MPRRTVIVGAGPAGMYAAETIRSLDATAAITLVGDEPPHARMALPYWLAGQVPRAQTLTGGPELYARLQLDARIGVRATALDPTAQRVELSDGTSLEFDALLLALGSRPRRLAIPGAELPGVQTMWSLADTETLLDGLQPGTEVCLIGAGFIGLIVLNALWKRRCKLQVVESADHILPRMLGVDAAGVAEQWLSARGVSLHPGEQVERIEADGSRRGVILADGGELSADRVILATGVQPNVELARAAGLKVESGILVDQRCRTSAPGIYAAGDCAAGPNLLGGPHEVHAIQPTAVDHGRVAGANMAGKDVEYPGSLSMNILDVAGLQCVSFGNWTGDGPDTQVLRNAGSALYRKLVWDGGALVGAVFVGPMNDVGMLNDVGMVKGFIQSQVQWGEWTRHLQESPADLRRPYVALGVPQLLVARTLLGAPSVARSHRAGDLQPTVDRGPHHAVFVGGRG